jgi:hypothetical protein
MALGTPRIPWVISGTIALLVAFNAEPLAQGRGGEGSAAPRQLAPVDLTGYWVSLITEDWRYRMIAGAKGDFPGIPLNAEGRKVGMAWDPAKDQAAGEQCKAYGAAAIMRMPTRLHVVWESDHALKLETDAGTQVRVLNFSSTTSPTPSAPSWQGTSVASWDLVGGRGSANQSGGGLKVVTTNMRAGYLRRNGPPYSSNATMTEFYDVVKEPDGTQYMVVTSILEDPTYLNQPLLSSAQFKKLPDASGWNPTPCTAG